MYIRMYVCMHICIYQYNTRTCGKDSLCFVTSAYVSIRQHDSLIQSEYSLNRFLNTAIIQP